MKGLKTRCMATMLSLAMVVSMLPQEIGYAAAKEGKPKESASLLLANYEFSKDNVEGTTIKDLSGNNKDATLVGDGATIADGTLTLPGGSATSTAAYVSIPGDVFENQDVLTISLWLKNETGANNYSAMWFGTPTKSYGGGTATMPLNYWLLNPSSPSGCFKSVWTDSNSASSPYNTETATSTTKTSSDWGMYTTVITKDSITGYYNGSLVGTSKKTKTTSDFGTGLVAAIGRSGYSDMYYKGGVRDVTVYGNAFSQEEVFGLYYDTIPEENKDQLILEAITADEKALDLGDLSGVTEDLTLPSMGERGSKITWKSSNPVVISESGAVTRPVSEQNAKVTLTATLAIGTVTKTKEFNVTVRSASVANTFQEVVSAFVLPVTAITDSISLPTTAGKVNGKDTTITWTSSNTNILTNDGTLVGRPEAGKEDETITMTATIYYKEGATVLQATKDVTITVLAKGYGYLMAYTNSKEAAVLGDSLHLAYSKDGKNYTALNSNTGICFANNVGGTKNTNPNGLLTPYIFRKSDGTYGMVARNRSSEKYFYLYDSTDLIEFTNEHTIAVDKAVSEIMQCSFDEEKNAYVIYWSDGTNTYKTITKDGTKAESTEEASDYSKPTMESAESLPEGAVTGNVLAISKTEYDRIVNTLGVVTNIGMEPISVTAKNGSSLSSLLPSKVTADYSDGSKTDMNVTWKDEDLKKVDLTKAGTYKVTGTVEQTTYANPFITQRADPCITKGEDGYYYFTASYPMCGSKDKEGYDRIILRRSKTIEGLKDAEEVAIWKCDDSATEFRYIWAPEFHCINGVYYIFYTSSINSSVWSIRPHVLMCKDASNIMDPSAWVAKGQMLAKDTDVQAFNGFSLDMTYFENNGHHYVMWAQTDGFSSLFIAEINPDKPWQCISDCVKISVPEYSWERINENVNEGPSVISKDGKLYCTFSASGTGTEYCIGLLTADANANLLDASSWKKQSYPVLTSSDVKGEYGPGHNSFTVDEDGNVIFVYHARGEECYNKQCEWANDGSLYDPCRDARIKRVHWAADGSPILKMTYGEELAQENKTVTATVTVPASPSEPKEMYTLTYKASKGGSIQGKASQKVEKGKDGAKVTAVAAKGYHFVSWSDGVKTAARIDKKVTASRTVTAQFAKNTVEAKKVAINKSRLTLGVGEKYQLKATITPSNTTNKKITWKSNSSCVKVSSKGVVTARKTGTAVITATASNGKKTTCKITVKKAPTKITLSKTSKTLKKGKKYQIKVTLPKNCASYEITYSSSKKSVATVSSSGKVVAKKKGKAIITVRTYNGKKAKIVITVK